MEKISYKCYYCDNEKVLNKKIDYKILNIAKNEIPYQSLDYSKIKRTLGWEPKENIRSTAKKILGWYRKSYFTRKISEI